MTRHKSRVARRSRRRARRGTRKQSGGFAWLKKLLGMKTADETTGAAGAVGDAGAPAADAVAPAVAPATVAAVLLPFYILHKEINYF